MEYFSCFSLHLFLASATLVTSLGPRLGSSNVCEPKAQFGELDAHYNSSSFLKGVIKMADIDIDPFHDHDKMDPWPDKTGETLSHPRRSSSWRRSYLGTRTRNAIWRKKSQRTRLKEAQVEGLYQKLTKITCQTPETFHFEDFELKDGELYYKDKSMS